MPEGKIFSQIQGRSRGHASPKFLEGHKVANMGYKIRVISWVISYVRNHWNPLEGVMKLEYLISTVRSCDTKLRLFVQISEM